MSDSNRRPRGCEPAAFVRGCGRFGPILMSHYSHPTTRHRPLGSGSVFQIKSGRWIAQITLPRSPDGRRHYNRHIADTREQAEALLAEMAPVVTPESRFWAYVAKGDGCWEWQSTRDTNGYGLFWNGTRRVPAHRFAWELVNGPIPAGLEFCHNCPGGDNKRCVRPDHAFLGTQLENTQDYWAKRRAAVR